LTKKSKNKNLGTIFDLIVHPTEKILFSCSKDNSIRVWDLKTKECIRKYELEIASMVLIFILFYFIFHFIYNPFLSIFFLFSLYFIFFFFFFFFFFLFFIFFFFHFFFLLLKKQKCISPDGTSLLVGGIDGEITSLNFPKEEWVSDKMILDQSRSLVNSKTHGKVRIGNFLFFFFPSLIFPLIIILYNGKIVLDIWMKNGFYQNL